MTAAIKTRGILGRAVLAAVAGIGLCHATAQANHYNFTGDGDGTSWEDLANWVALDGDQGLPGSTNTVFINQDHTVNLSTAQSIRDFAIGHEGGVATLNILDGANLTVGETSRIGRSVESAAGDTTGRVIQSGGTFSLTGDLRMSFDPNFPATSDSYYGISGGSLSVSNVLWVGRETTTFSSAVFEVIGSGAESIEAHRFYTRVNTATNSVPTVSFVLDSGGVTPIRLTDVLELRDAPSHLAISLSEAQVPGEVTLFEFGRLRATQGNVTARFLDTEGTLLDNGDEVTAIFGDNAYIWTIHYVDTGVGEPGNGIFLRDLRIEPLTPLLPGDANRDGRVDGEDFLIWQASFGVQSGATWDDGDFNGDGRVDGEDFLIWQAHFGSVAESSAITPEPSGLAALVGLAGLLIHRRRS